MGNPHLSFLLNQSHVWFRWNQTWCNCLYLCLGIVRFIRANESETEEEIAAPLYLNENHLNNRIARSIDPYSYYWNDLKRGDPSHLLRFAKRSGGMDDHMLRFAKKSVGDDHFLRFANKSGMDDHMLRFAKKSNMDDHFLRFAKNYDDHLLRFAKKDDPEMAVELPEVEESNDVDDSKMDLAKRWYYTRGSRGQMNDHMLRFA